MHGESTARVSLRHFQIWEVTTKFNSGICKALLGLSGIADSIDRDSPIAQPTSRRYEKLFQFSGPLLVAPVPYPDHVRIFLARQRAEMRCVRGLMKCPHSLDAETVKVDTANRLPKREHAIKPRQRQTQNLFRIGVCPMMRIVK